MPIIWAEWHDNCNMCGKDPPWLQFLRLPDDDHGGQKYCRECYDETKADWIEEHGEWPFGEFCDNEPGYKSWLAAQVTERLTGAIPPRVHKSDTCRPPGVSIPGGRLFRVGPGL